MWPRETFLKKKHQIETIWSEKFRRRGLFRLEKRL